jgi:molybdopterin-guanine dinucleotide biosynthesis protein A
VPSAAILAGGRASRFGGRDKSALIVNGRTILDRQLSALDGLADLIDDLMIVGAPRPVGGRECRFVNDRLAGCGPLGGLEAALLSARQEHVLLLACDMPFLSQPFLRFLLELPPDADVSVPRTERGYHPLCAVYSRRCLSAVTRRLNEGRLKLSGLLDEVRVRVVEQDGIEQFGRSGRLLANVNTPAELDDLEALLGHEV